MPHADSTRRLFMMASGSAAAGLLVSGCAGERRADAAESSGGSEAASKAKEVTANEDLMREHGVLRRALLVYSESAPRLRQNPGTLPVSELNRTAKLFRRFGEDYHERRLEETFILPAVREAGGPGANIVDTLQAQHDRGREITDYILAATARGRLGTAEAENLARALDGFVLMYRAHTAREDTIVFPAWKQALTPAQYDELGDRFEDIEHELFGEDGFEDAVKQMAQIESALGLADLARFTAPPPPRA